MNQEIGTLRFLPIETSEIFVSQSVFKTALALDERDRPLVAEIDPQHMGGSELCEHYKINPEDGANCVIVEVVGSSVCEFAAIVVPVGYRADLNNIVKKHFNAKRISLALLDVVLKVTGMEYGSITPFGLPVTWKILVDTRLASKEKVIVGGGKQVSKLLLPITTLKNIPNVEFIDGLSNRF